MKCLWPIKIARGFSVPQPNWSKSVPITMLTTLVVFIGCFPFHAFSKEASPISVYTHKDFIRTSYTPFASSYLSLLSNHLSGGLFSGQPWGVKENYNGWYNLNRPNSWKILVQSNLTPLIKRFDAITKKYYQQPPISDIVHEEFSAPAYTVFWKTALWEGFCHRRSAASIDPRVNQLATNQYGLLCDDVILSQGEIKELFTAFSPYGDVTYVGQSNSPATAHTLRDLTGFDDLSAGDFHSTVYRRLNSNLALAVEKDSSHKVNNQSLFAAKFQRHRLSLGEASLNFLVSKIPMITLVDRTGSNKKLLTLLADMQNHLKTTAINWNPKFEAHKRWKQWAQSKNAILVKRGSSSDYYEYKDDNQLIVVNQKKILSAFEAQIQKEIAKNTESLQFFFQINGLWLAEKSKPFAFLHEIQKKLTELNLGFFFQLITENILRKKLINGEVALKKNIPLYLYTTTITHREDTPFNTPEVPGQHIQQETYRYLLAELNHKVVFSTWLTESTRRPDFIWWPAPIDLQYYKNLNTQNRSKHIQTPDARLLSAFISLLKLLNDCEPLENFLLPGHPPELGPMNYN